MTKINCTAFSVFTQMKHMPTWHYEPEQNTWITDLTIREGGTSQDHGFFASETWVHRCNVWGIMGTSEFGPVKSQGSWKLFTCTNLVDPYFELIYTDMVSTKLSFLKVLRKDRRKIISESSLLGRLPPFSLKPHKSQKQSYLFFFFKLLQIFWCCPMNAAFITILDQNIVRSL